MTTSASESEPGDSRSSYLGRHFRGEQPLAVSWWVNWVFLGHVVPGLLARAAIMFGDRESASLQDNAILLLAVLALSAVFWGWAVVGVVRSASRHAQRGGSSTVATIALALVALRGLTTFFAAATPQGRGTLVEFVRLAQNDDPLPLVSTSLMADDHVLMLEGSLGQGSARHVTRELARHHAIKTLRLHSNGGRLLEARAIARAVAQRGLDTYVTGRCESACTIVFLAGVQRALSDVGKLGFHRPSIGGADAPLMDAAPMLNAYREAGLSSSFIERVAGVASNTIWYPTPAELTDNGIVTRIVSREDMTNLRAELHGPDQLRTRMREDHVWVAAEARFPTETEDALKSAWSALAAGAPDARAIAMLKAKLSLLVQEAMRVATDEQLEANFALQQQLLNLTRTTNPQHCRAFISGREPLVQSSATHSLATTPAQLEHEFLVKLLESRPRVDQRPPGVEATAALRRVSRQLSPMHVSILEESDDIPWSPKDTCDAATAFFDAVARLPSASRRPALRRLFQLARPTQQSPKDGPESKVASGVRRTERPRTSGDWRKRLELSTLLPQAQSIPELRKPGLLGDYQQRAPVDALEEPDTRPASAEPPRTSGVSPESH